MGNTHRVVRVCLNADGDQAGEECGTCGQQQQPGCSRGREGPPDDVQQPRLPDEEAGQVQSRHAQDQPGAGEVSALHLSPLTQERVARAPQKSGRRAAGH